MNGMRRRADDAFDAEREMAGISSRQPGGAITSDVEGDLGAGVACPDNEDAAVLELRRIPVGAGMSLDDAGVKVLGERWEAWLLVVRHRHHDIGGLELAIASCHDEPIAVPARRSTAVPVRTGKAKRAA